MAYRITEGCSSCGMCILECPCNAIIEGEPFIIDVEKCTECGACYEVCPMEVIRAPAQAA